MTASATTWDLGLVLPAFDEEVRLPSTLSALSMFVKETGLTLQVVVANDGSRDRSSEVVRTFELDPNVEMLVDLVDLPHAGKGSAVRAGIGRLDATVVGYCDVDLSAGIPEIRRLANRVGTDSDVVMGSRALAGAIIPVHQPWLRERAGRVFNRVIRFATGLPFRDTQCGLKLFSLPAARSVFENQHLDGFAFDVEVVMLALKLGFSVEEVPIRWSHRSGSSVSMTRELVHILKDVLRTVRYLGRIKRGTLECEQLADGSFRCSPR